MWTLQASSPCLRTPPSDTCDCADAGRVREEDGRKRRQSDFGGKRCITEFAQTGAPWLDMMLGTYPWKWDRVTVRKQPSTPCPFIISIYCRASPSDACRGRGRERERVVVVVVVLVVVVVVIVGVVVVVVVFVVVGGVVVVVVVRCCCCCYCCCCCCCLVLLSLSLFSL